MKNKIEYGEDDTMDHVPFSKILTRGARVSNPDRFKCSFCKHNGWLSTLAAFNPGLFRLLIAATIGTCVAVVVFGIINAESYKALMSHWQQVEK